MKEIRDRNTFIISNKLKLKSYWKADISICFCRCVSKTHWTCCLAKTKAN